MTSDATGADDADNNDESSEADARDVSVAGCLERVLSHAEAQGEAYAGAVDDHTTIRAALSDGSLSA